jgi:curved DNA-binding protein CbpA
MNKTLYDVLQVSSKADSEVIAAAYARLSAKLDGDELKAVKQAYEVIGNGERRAAYDTKLQQQPATPPYARAEYRGRAASVFMEWWQSPRMLGMILFIVILAAAALYVSYLRNERRTEVAKEAVTVERVKVEATAKTDERRVENETRNADAYNEIVHQSMELNRRNYEQRIEESRARIVAEEDRLRLQRERQQLTRENAQFDKGQSLRAEDRQAEDRQDAIGQRQLQREREELCRIERARYGRAISC